MKNMKTNFIDKITIFWIIIMFVSASVGIFCGDSIFEIKTIHIVISLIILWFCYVLFNCKKLKRINGCLNGNKYNL